MIDMLINFFCFFSFLAFLFCHGILAQGAVSLQLKQSIVLPNVRGRIDHMDIDIKGQRLFVAALGNYTLEVVDLKSGKLNSIGGLNEPQDVRFIGKTGQVFVTNGGSGRAELFDGKTFSLIRSFALPDADNLRYDHENNVIYVGYGDGAIGLINTISWKNTAHIQLKAHPESFQLERDGSRIFVNVPEAGHIAVLDGKTKEVLKVWPVQEGTANYAMGMDEHNHRLFVGLRSPSKLLVLDNRSGQVVSWLDLCSDNDDIFYDPKRKQIYASCGEGSIYVYKQKDADHYQFLDKVPTARGARTSLFVPALGQLFVAVPRHGEQAASIRIYGLF